MWDDGALQRWARLLPRLPGADEEAIEMAAHEAELVGARLARRENMRRASWRACVKKACENGGGAAHRASTRQAPLPLVDPQAAADGARETWNNFW